VLWLYNLGLGGVIRDFAICYISWDLIIPVVRLVTFRADIISLISARALGGALASRFGVQGLSLMSGF
jgi:hypothetical protein